MFFPAEPRGIEPRSSDFQSDAYTTSAKAPFLLVGAPGLEPEPPESKSGVLTAALCPNVSVAPTGLEPVSLHRERVTSWPFRRQRGSVGVPGFEPGSPESESGILDLCTTPQLVVVQAGLEPADFCLERAAS